MANHNFILDLLVLGILSLLGLLLLNFAGKIMAPLFSITKQDKPYFNFFIEALTGFIFLTTIYAVLLFGVNTVSIISVLFFAGVLIYRFSVKKEKINYTFNKYDLKQLIFIPAIPFISLLISLILSPAKSLQSDISFYCKIAESLSLINKENFFHFFNLHGAEFNGTVPYHYIEMYLGSLFFKIFSWTGYTDIILFKYVVYNSLKSLVFIGLLAFVEKFKKPSLLEFILVTCILCIDFVFITDFDYTSYPLYTGMWMRPNFIIYHLFLIVMLYFLFDKNYLTVSTFVLLFIISTAVVAPPLLVGCGILLLWVILFRKDKRALAAKLLFAALLLAFSIALFYKLTGVKSEAMGAYSLSAKEIIHKSLSIWKAIVGFTITLSIRLLVLVFIAFIPVMLLGKKLFIDYIKTNSFFIAFIVLIPLSGIVIFQSVAYLDNMYQFPYVGYVGCYLLFIFNVFNFLAKERTGIRKNIGFAVIGLLVITGLYAKRQDVNKSVNFKDAFSVTELRSFGLSDSTVHELSEYFNKKSGLKGGNILDQKDIKEEFMGFRQSLTAQPGFYLMYLQDNTNIESLTDPSELYPDTDLTTKDYLKASAFNKLTDFYKNYKTDSSYIFNLKEYIKQNKINYLVLSRQFETNRLKDIVVKKRITDANTGYQFLILE